MNIIVTNGYIPAHSEEHAEKLLEDIRSARAEIESSPANMERFALMMDEHRKRREAAAAKWEAEEAALETAQESQPPRTPRRRAAVAA